MTKAFNIPKSLVWEAYLRVKKNRGAAGVDRISLEEFDKNLKSNLYKIWNRLSSGSYFPSPTMTVGIPKKCGGQRMLGIPTISDRIAQMVVKTKLEPEIDSIFIEDSYGYRPNKSALDAVGITRKRRWKYDRVVEYDIKGLFDNIPHKLLMKGVLKQTDCRWSILYIERWLKAPTQELGSQTMARTRGTPQGGLIGPLLASLFLHYAIDVWLKKIYPNLPSCRYADDGLIHCHNEKTSQRSC